MSIHSCYHFDTVMFIKYLKKWRKEKERLKEELDAIPHYPPAMNESGVRGTDVSDPTPRIADREMEILRRIAEIENCEYIYEKAKGTLTEDELQIFCLFFEPKEPIGIAVDKYAQGKYTCRMNIYRQRRNILKKLDEVIENLL